MNRIILKGLTLIVALTFFAPSANAAKYLLSDNANLVKGCSGTIEIKVDTEGVGVIAGDSTVNINNNEVVINQVSIGNILPMQVFNQFTDSQIKLSAARLPMSGAFDGVGTYGYINFTPKSDSIAFTFAPDLTGDNTLVDENINNVLTEVQSKAYAAKERFNVNIDGVGFCTPDTTGPTVQFVAPPPSSGNNATTTHIIYVLSDDRTGVDINTLQMSVNSASFSSTSTQLAVNPDGNRYRVEYTPDQAFLVGATVSVKVKICDKNSPANCTDASASFRIATPTPPPAICGDGILNPESGEQCDDSNRISGDSCSSFCLIETPPLAPASCFDGIQNQGESAVDCGGPCKPCATCVDGIQNQGETSVDCGGPCPPCGVQPQVVCEVPVSAVPAGVIETVMICHTPIDNPRSPYTMIIPKSAWPDYEKNGDTIGACDVEALCNLLMPVAPEIEKKAMEQAQVVVAQEKSLTEQAVVIEAPKTQEKVIDQIDICKAIPDYRNANFDSASSDTDGDGLSDRTECYAKTSPINPDTDGDGCTDGDELNRFSTNPLDGKDCKLISETQGFNQVMITDPKPSWTLGILSPRFSGLTPIKSKAITLTAFHADQKVIKDLSAAVSAMLQANTLELAKNQIKNLKTVLDQAQQFTDLNGADFNYTELVSVIQKIQKSLPELEKAYSDASTFVTKDYFDLLKKLGFGDIGLELGALLREPIVIGSTNQFSDALLSGQTVSSFEFLTPSALEDQKLYDVVATATVGNTNISSSPIQFGVNTGFTVSRPIPRTLGGKLIPSGGISSNNLWIQNAFAQGPDGQPVIEISEDKPVITGDTEFGSQVFAIWNSVVLSSSVISDSEKGAFEIQAPKNLETGVSHRVTLYAVKTDQNKTLRSESIDVYFRIKAAKMATTTLVIIVVISLGFIAGAYYLIMRLRRAHSFLRILKGSQKK